MVGLVGQRAGGFWLNFENILVSTAEFFGKWWNVITLFWVPLGFKFLNHFLNDKKNKKIKK